MGSFSLIRLLAFAVPSLGLCAFISFEAKAQAIGAKSSTTICSQSSQSINNWVDQTPFPTSFDCIAPKTFKLSPSSTLVHATFLSPISFLKRDYSIHSGLSPPYFFV